MLLTCTLRTFHFLFVKLLLLALLISHARCGPETNIGEIFLDATIHSDFGSSFYNDIKFFFPNFNPQGKKDFTKFGDPDTRHLKSRCIDIVPYFSYIDGFVPLLFSFVLVVPQIIRCKLIDGCYWNLLRLWYNIDALFEMELIKLLTWEGMPWHDGYLKIISEVFFFNKCWSS